MKIEKENGFVAYTIEESEVTIDNIKVLEQRKGAGRELLNEVKKIASDLGLPIGLYSAPMDDTISDEELLKFYFANGFRLDTDDVDGHLLIF